VCQQCGVHTKPLIIQLPGERGGDDTPEGGSRGDRPRVILLPFLSWYHSTFDTDPELPHHTLAEVAIPGMRPFEERWADFKWCSWPDSVAPRDSDWNRLASPSRASSCMTTIHTHTHLHAYTHIHTHTHTHTHTHIHRGEGASDTATYRAPCSTSPRRLRPSTSAPGCRK